MAKMGYVQIIAMCIAVATLFFSLPRGVAAKTNRLDELRKLQSSSLLINFEWKEFDRYIIQNPGDYQIVMFYTVAQGCPMCESVESELAEVSYSFISANKQYGDEESKQIPIFFARISFTESNKQPFVLSEFRSVPVLALADKSLADFYSKNKNLTYETKKMWQMGPQDFSDAGKLLEHVNKISGHKVELKYTLWKRVLGTGLIMAVLGCVFLLKKVLLYLITNRIVWMVGSAIIFIQCVGGIAYTLIHSVPLFKYGHDSTGNMIIEEYFQRNQRGQWGGEGYIVSMIMFLIASCIIGFMKTEKMKNGFKKEALCLGLITTAFVLLMALTHIYTLKSPGYNPDIFPPDHYMRGPLSVDQGTSI